MQEPTKTLEKDPLYLNQRIDHIEKQLKMFSTQELAQWRMHLAQIDAVIVNRLDKLRQ